MLGATQKQLFDMDGNEITGFKPYQAYSKDPNDYVAGFSPMQQQAMQATGQLGVPSQYGQATQMTGMAGLGSLGLAGQMAGAGQNFAQQAQDPRAMQGYMSPYMQNVVDYQKSQALRDYNLGTGVRKAQATGAGAFGGNRQALMEAEAQRSLGNQLQGITAQGSQQAFQDAQKQQQFGAQLGLQGQQGAMQGLGQYGQMAGQLGQLGGQELAARQGIIQSQYGMGQQQQAMEQQKINQAMQDWANTQQYPLMQLGVMSNMLRGLPMQASTTNQYTAAPNALTQGIGAAGAGASLYNALRGKEGGLPSEFESSRTGIKSYYEGDVVESTKSDLYDLPLEELEKRAKSSTSPTIKRLATAIAKEKRMGLAGGGIIAFASGTEDTVGADARAAEGKRLINDYEQEVADRARAKFNFGEPKKTPALEPINVETVERVNPAAVRQAQIDAANLQSGNATSPTLPTPEQLANPRMRAALTPRAEVNPASIVAAAPAEERQTAQSRVRGKALTIEDILRPSDSPRLKAARASEEKKPYVLNEAEKQSEADYEAARPNPVKPSAAKPSADAPTADTKKGSDTGAGIKTVTPSTGVGIKPNTGIVPDIGGIKGPTNLSTGLERPAEDPYAKMSISEIAKEKLAFLGPDVRKEERAGLMAERASAKDEARRAQSLRFAEFFAAWGSTPGSTIAAGLKALQEKVPNLVTDEREAARIRRAINKDIAGLDKADRLEKAGAWDEAAKLKMDLGKGGRDTYGKELDFLSRRMSDASGIEVAKIGAAAKGGSDNLTKLLAAQTAKTDEVRKIYKDNDGLVRDANMPNPNNSPAIKKIKDDAEAKLNELTKEPKRQLDQINGLVDAHSKIQALSETGKIATPTVSDTVTSGGKTYNRSDYPKMTDAQWAQYQEAAKKASGAK
jgi:hypothetical protein